MRRSISVTLVFLMNLSLACQRKPTLGQKAGAGVDSGGVSLMPPEQPPSEQAKPPAPVEATAVVAEQPAVAAEPERLRVAFGGCDRAACPLDFTFSLPMVDAARLATAPPPKLVLDPPQKGRLAWQSPTVLRFTPAPDALAWGHQIEVTIPRAKPLAGAALGLAEPWRQTFTVPFFQVGGKVASWPVVKGQPRLVGVVNPMSGQIGSGPLLLLYDQKVGLDRLRKKFSVTNAEGVAQATRVFHPTSVDHVFSDAELDLDVVVAVKVERPLTEGETLVFQVPDWTDGAEATPVEARLTVNTTFTLSGYRFSRSQDGDGEEVAGDDGGPGTATNRVPLTADLHLTFSNAFQPSLLEKNLKIEPAPRSHSVSGSYADARLHLELEPGVHYRIQIARAFTDVLGNRPPRSIVIGFRSQDLPPQLTLPSVPLLVEVGAAALEARGRNLQQIKAESVVFASPAAFANALARGKKETCRAYGAEGQRQPVQVSSATKVANTLETLTMTLSRAPALACVELRARGAGSEASGEVRGAVLVQSSNIGITAKVAARSVLAWITRLADARPIAHAQVTLLDERGARLGEGTTDERGIVTLDTRALGALKRPVLLLATANGETAVTTLVNDQLSQPWQFGLKGELPEAQPLAAALFTERGAYRPGETVHIKAIAPRGLASGGGDKLEIEVRDPRGQEVARKRLTLDAFGAAALDVRLKEGAPVGAYLLSAKQGNRVAVRNFRVEEYRVPTFAVEVRGTSPWKRGVPATAVITGKYLHGGTLDGRQVRWQLSREPQVFSAAALPGFVFGLGDASGLAGGLTSSDQRLDGAGQLRVAFTPDHPPSAGPMRYLVEATVTDVDRQAYAGRYAAVVHPAAFYLGLLPPTQKVLSAEETLKVPLVAVSPDGKVVAGVKVRAQVERIDYHTTARVSGAGDQVQVINRPVEVERGQCLTATRDVPVICTFKLGAAGQYRVRAWATDLEQQSVQAGFELSVAGDNTVAWPRFDQDRIGVLADRPVYKPGQVARLVVQSPFARAQGLLTLEREGILEARPFRIDGDTPSIDVPITAAHAPNVFASVVLLRGRVHHDKDATGFETGAPAFKIGYATLAVDAPERRLDVQVKAARPISNPGEKLAIKVSARDAAGTVRPAQVTLMVVDEAVLGLTGHKTPEPLAQIYAERPLGVRTGESRLDLPFARRSRHEQIFPGGDGEEGGEDGKRADLPRELQFDLRRVWKSTAYWNPKLDLGADGTVTVVVDMPDNITAYRIMAVVSDRDGRAGSAEDKVTLKRPLMVQPVLPRFAYPDDELQIEALVFNDTPAAGNVQVATKLEGLKLVSGEPTVTAGVASAASGTFRFKVRVTGRGQATVRFAARLGAHKDGVEVKLPILSPGTRRIVVASQLVHGNGNVTVNLPADRLPGTAKIEVVASTTSLTELKDAVQYLMEYPNGCIEQTTSTAYPLVVLKELLPEIGVTVDQAELKKFSEAGVRRILSFQTGAGGLSYWPGSSQPHAFATAFGLTALIEGKKRGYDVPDAALARMADYLETSLKQGQVTGEMPHGGMADADTRAFFVMTLGRLGRPQPGYVSSLWQKRTALSPFGLAVLGVAATELPGDHAQVRPILAEVKRAAKVAAEEAWYESAPRGGWSFDSPLRTHAGALLAFASAGANADGEMTGKLLRGLLQRRRNGMWGNTQENVFGIMGIATLSGASTAGPSAPRMQLTLGSKRIGDQALEKVSPRVRRIRLVEAELGLKPGEPQSIPVAVQGTGGAVYLTVRAEYEQVLSEEVRKPVTSGFRIERRYETMEGASLEGRPIPLGSLVRVRLAVHADSKQNYVAIDDKLPAGLEPLNAALETTERVAKGTLTPVGQRSLELLSYSEIRDARVAFYVDEMAAGDYAYAYVARATTPGAFLRPAGRVEAMYRPEIAGSTAIDSVTVVK
jgi:uncharacterized protein YfaS (alpha-2-macroglobulin family)